MAYVGSIRIRNNLYLNFLFFKKSLQFIQNLLKPATI
jgi:hypothetical protein